ncbi:MAG TPA: NAD(P)(+) transhydrogenase (Re/Si-specific) subunit beta, partial [Anaerovoracaceae bacterium]|nr:NAD(P)(+) transhydrogenase (Re/Si-specific) subunit beta [Anaerovoracaceae bacterium]
MFQGLITVAYLIAALLFILSLAGLSKQETAKMGNLFGITGMAIALLATIANANVQAMIYILVAMLIGSLIGARLAVKVEMTGMPELVACLHSFVGLAAVLVGYNSFLKVAAADGGEAVHGALLTIELTEIFLGVFIGAITFTGSIVAFGKLRGIIKSKALSLPGKHWLNLAAIVASIVLMILFINVGGSMLYLAIM